MGLRALSLLSLASLSFLGAGCLSNSNNPTFAEDAGSFDFDTGIPFFDAPVTDTSAPPPDATAPDAAPLDAGAPDAPVDAGPLPVTLLVVDTSGHPEPGVTVVFSDASGAVLSSTTTGNAGTVSQVVAAGSQVTALFGSAAAPSLLTIVAVAPGDTLTVVDTTVPPPDSNVDENVTVTALPGAPLDGGGGEFTVNAGTTCSGAAAGAPVSFNVTSLCENGGKYPLLAQETDVNGTPVAFTYEKGVALAADGGLDEAGTQEVSMADAGPWTPISLLSVSGTNGPTESFLQFVFTEVSGGVPFAALGSAPTTSGSAQVSFVAHPGYPDFVQLETNFVPPSQSTSESNGTAYAAIATRAATLAAVPTTVDVTTALPALTSSVLDFSNVARPSVGWSTSAPFTSVDGAILVATWNTDAEVSVSGLWTFIAPPTQSLVQAPVLPAAVAAWAPVSGASFGVPTVVLAEATFWPGYDAFRATSAGIAAGAANALANCIFGDNARGCVPVLPTDGTIRITAFLPGGG